MVDGLPKFDGPPVVETVLSAQFKPLPKFSAALAGWFWRAFLDETEWNEAIEVVRVDDHFERFEENALWPAEPMFSFAQMQTFKPRVQISRADGTRMIQVQDSRFIFNWRKKDDAYPSYKNVRAEFDQCFHKFRLFTLQTMDVEPELNQWELTYVNQIPKGPLWSSVDEWNRVLPTFYPPTLPIESKMESRSGDWRFVLGANRGRLYVSVRHGKTKESQEFMGITLTARGPVDADMGLGEGLDFAHSAIVKSFAGITSDEARKFWKQRA